VVLMISTRPLHVYGVRPRKDHRGVDLISDVPPLAARVDEVGSLGRPKDSQRSLTTVLIATFVRCVDRSEKISLAKTME
jgi:hypothetical protein